MSVSNLLEAIGEYYPQLQVSCFGDPDVYGDLVSEDGQPIPAEQTLRDKILDGSKAAKIDQLSKLCAKHILDGFVSSALGSPHKYDAEDVDQINLLGSVTATLPTAENPNGTSQLYAVRPVVDGIYQAKTYVLHTHQQLRQAVSDGAEYKLQCLHHFNDLRDTVNAAVTMQDVEAVTW